MRIVRAWLAASWIALAAGPALAGEVTITFDFSGSTISILGGILNIPPGGSITAASGNAIFIANGPTQITAGPARLEALTLAATIDDNVLGQAQVDGDILAQQLAGSPGGVLSAGLGSAAFQNILLSLDVDATCVGIGCPFIGTFPIAIAGNFTAIGMIAALGNLETLSAATMMATLPFSLSGFSGVLQIVGTEVSRSFNPVPEPASLGTLGLGLFALALASRARRSRAAR